MGFVSWTSLAFYRLNTYPIGPRASQEISRGVLHRHIGYTPSKSRVRARISAVQDFGRRAPMIHVSCICCYPTTSYARTLVTTE